MIAALDKVVLRKLTEELNAAAQEVAKRHGVIIEIGGGTYAPESATLKCRIACGAAEGASSVAEVQARADWQHYAVMFGLDPALLGTKIDHKGKPFEIVGLMPSRQKFPVAVKGSDGKLLLLTIDEVKRKTGVPS